MNDAGRVVGSNTAWPATRRDQLAADWCRLGVAVFPLNWITPAGICSCPRGKACTSPGKDPHGRLAPRGVHDASLDSTVVSSWWTDAPYANIGLAMGKISGVWALDVDPKNGGDETLAALLAEHGELPDTPQTHTGGGGIHYFFTYDPRVKNTTGALGAGLDTRSDGGYVVGAGSNHASGRSYVLDTEYAFGDVQAALAPEWMVELLTASSSPGTSGDVLPAVWDKERNVNLFTEACRLRHRGWTEQEIGDALVTLDANRSQPPKGEQYCRDMARRVVRRYTPAGELELWFADSKVTDPPDEPLPPVEIHPLTELGNSHRLIDRHGRNIRYCYELKQWLAWDGNVWEHDSTSAVKRKAVETIQALSETEAGRHMSPPNSKGECDDMLPKFIKAVSNNRAFDNMVTLASIDSSILVSVDALDTHHFLLPMLNGTLDLTTGRLHESQRDHLMTLKVPLVFDPSATCPRFERFVSEIFDFNKDLVSFMQELLGYALTGSMSEAIMAICYGQGANGKSVLMDTIHAVLGPYAMTAAPGTFDAEQSNAIPIDLAAMRGARFVTAAESEDRYELEMATIKRITGGDRIRARFLFKDFFSYSPTGKIFLSTNSLPGIRGADTGSWRRVCCIPFTVQFGFPGFPPAENKEHLTRALYNERQGILNWMLVGCLRWQRYGLNRPAIVDTATQSYRDQQDILGPFIDDCLRQASGCQAPKADVYRRYVTHCELNRTRSISSKAFSQQMMARGFQAHRTATTRYWSDVELIDVSYQGRAPFQDN